jgi:phenylacetate-CoA ligase
VVEPDPDSTGPFHRYNAAERQTYLSPYHLGPDTVDQYIDALRRSDCQWIEGYASATHDIAHMALERGIECPRLRAIITTAEPSSMRLREDVRRAFGCRAHEDYGLVEEACMALECEHGALHAFPDSGYVEILDEDGQPCPPGEFGEIVATSFVRLAQPFVRYHTGDVAAWRAEPCACGRAMPVFESVEGRLDDIVVGADGRRVGRLSTVPKHLEGVVFTQFVQERPGAVLVRVVAEGDLRPDVREELLRRLETRLGSETDIEIEQVDELERTARGKMRAVVSSVAQRL